VETLRQLFERFRSDVDDNADPGLWSSNDLEVYLNWALTQLAERALYFFDRTTWASLPVTADDPQLAATSANKLQAIIKVYRARLASTEEDLTVGTMAQVSEAVRKDDYGQISGLSSTSWEVSTGTPRVLVTDYYDDGSLRLGPIPTGADTVSLWAFRRPLKYVSYEASGKISIAEAIGVSHLDHQLALIQGMKAMAYRKSDPEALDLDLAQAEEERFSSKLLEIKAERQRTLRPPGTVRYGGL